MKTLGRLGICLVSLLAVGLARRVEKGKFSEGVQQSVPTRALEPQIVDAADVGAQSLVEVSLSQSSARSSGVFSPTQAFGRVPAPQRPTSRHVRQAPLAFGADLLPRRGKRLESKHVEEPGDPDLERGPGPSMMNLSEDTEKKRSWLRIPWTKRKEDRVEDRSIMKLSDDSEKKSFWSRLPWLNREGKQEKEENEDGEEALMEKVKKYGIAGVISYVFWDGGFWTVGGLGGYLSYFLTTGQWPDISVAQQASAVGAVSFAIVNLGLPLRVALAVSSAPWIDENIVQRFGLSKSQIDWDNFAEDFMVCNGEECDITDGSLKVQEQMMQLVSMVPLRDDLVMQITKESSEGPDGEQILTMRWKFDIQAADLTQNALLEELEKSFHFPLEVSGSSIFTRNTEGKVASMRLGAWTINGEELPLPKFDELTQADQGALQKWAKSMAA
jgi:hypothetical protein